MTGQRTFVDENRYLFTTDVDHDDFPTFVVVQWTALSFVAAEDFLVPLRSYLRPRHEVSEVWMLFPEDLLPKFEELRRSERFAADDVVGPRIYRFFAVAPSGELHEELRVEGQDVVEVTDSVAGAVIEDGLRQLFRDTDSLATAAAGFHFTHPSGTHSEHFIRSSQSVSRTNHCYFMAMALLRVVDSEPEDATIWVDTAAIAPVAYAYIDLLRRGGLAGVRRVESFGGYGGMETSLRPVPHDLVLVSGSTSGSLAKAVVVDKRVPLASVVTLFYLGQELPPAEAGAVLCDLTNRDDRAHPSIRESRILPYQTFSAGTCRICAMGSGEIRLEGDSFFPATLQLDMRMPTFADRPLHGVSGPRHDILSFDGQDYFEDLFGTGAITYAAGTPVDGSPHGVSTRLKHLLDVEERNAFTIRLDTAVQRSLEGAAPVAAVLSLLDDDSTALGKLLATRLLSTNREDNLDEEDVTWREWRLPGAESLSEAVEGGTILVCAAVVGSGRTLTSVSRDLRKVTGTFDTRYIVAAAHPESSTTWNMLTQTLRRVSPTDTSTLTQIWRLPREPRFPDAKSPWAREQATLTAVGTWLSNRREYRGLVPALENRTLQLGKLNSDTLFAGAKGDIASVNANFALWPFDWTKHSSGATPTHAEIYATVAHMLYESRRRSPRVDSRNITARRHGYALHPAVFDRFNDPVIQAAFLRAAEPGELHYTTDADASRAVADLLWFVLSNCSGEAGDAAYEFLLALCEGCDHENAPGMRIAPGSLRSVLAQLEDDRHLGTDFDKLDVSSNHVRALLLYLRDHS